MVGGTALTLAARTVDKLTNLRIDRNMIEKEIDRYFT